jgi:hypothetical protein
VRICFEAVGELRTLDRALDEKFFAQLNTTRMSLIDATPLLPEASVETEDLAPAVVRALRIYGGVNLYALRATNDHRDFASPSRAGEPPLAMDLSGRRFSLSVVWSERGEGCPPSEVSPPRSS